MNKKLTAFAAIKLFYESGNDLIQVFGQVVLLTVAENRKYSPSEIQSSFLSNIQMDIPIDVIYTILKRLKREGFIDYQILRDANLKSFQLTDKGRELHTKIEQNYNDANREKNALLKSLTTYFKNKGIDCKEELIEQKLNEFIDKNSGVAIDGLQQKQIESGVSENGIFDNFVDYFSETEKNDPDNFIRLKTILYGKILARAFLSRNYETNTKIEKLDIYLDTNIVFSLFGFHEEFYNKPVQEVVNLLKKAGCRLKVFTFTKDEVATKLSGYLREYSYYSSFVRVNSIYYILKRKGYSKSQIISFIENIESRLNELGIEIDYTHETKNLLESRGDQISEFSSYKLYGHPESIKHDLAAMHAVNLLRGGVVYRWEKSRSLFLTADSILTRYNFEKYHKNSQTFPEIVHRSDMASLLWVKGQVGSDNVFVHNFFANYMREKIISSNLWNKFIDEVKKQRESGRMSESDIEDLISDSETEKILIRKGEKGISEIFDDFKINERRNGIAQKELDYLQNEKIIAQQQEQLIQVSHVITEESKLFWWKCINRIVWVFVAILLIISGYVIYKFGVSKIVQLLGLLPLFFLVVLAISVTGKKEFGVLRFLVEWRTTFENRMVTRSIIKKKKKYLPDSE